MPRNKAGLTPQQQKLVDTLPQVGYNGAEAARQAGYAVADPKAARIRASTVLAKPHVRAVLDKQLETQKLKREHQTEKILADVADLIEIAMGRKDIPGIEAKRFDSAAAKAAIELYGKSMGLWIEKVQHVVSDEELIGDFQSEMSKRIAPETVDAILTAVEERMLARR